MRKRKGAGTEAGPNTKQTSRIDHNNNVRPKLCGNQCQCSGCGELFACVGTFDRHRVGDHGNARRCLSLGEMLAKGWIQNAGGFWIRGHRPNIAPASPGYAQERRSAEPLGVLRGAA
jgi:hypothetical protein